MSIHFKPLTIGIVTDNQDPDQKGRVKVGLKAVGEEYESSWLPVTTLYGSSDGGGVFFLPEVDDNVLVAFTGTNPDNGYILGTVWTDDIPPPESEENSDADLNGDGDNNIRFIKSRAGQMLIFDDTSDEEKLQILGKEAQSRIEMLVADELINIETDKDMIISAKGKLAFEADECEMTIDKEFKLEADSILMESSSKDIEVKASNNLALEGTTVKLN